MPYSCDSRFRSRRSTPSRDHGRDLRTSWHTGLGACVLLAGCYAPVPGQPDLPLQEPAALSNTTGATLPPARWWTSLHDAELDARIDAALSGNFSLAAAWERLQAAEAIAQRTSGERSPRVNGVVFGDVRDGNPIGHSKEMGLGLEAAFEVDLWGRIRSAAQADALRAESFAADYQTAALTLSAEYALAWFRLAETREQRVLIDSQLATNAQVLDVLELRFAVGQSGSTDVLRQRQLVEATREQALVAQARFEVLEHQLAVLEGREPQRTAALPVANLPALDAQPAAGLSTELLQRRPDVRAAFLQLQAADADVAAAAKERYPRFELSAALTTAAEDPTDLFTDWIGQLTAQVVAPLVDGGTRQAELDRTVAVRRQRVAEYGAVVLIAFQEVEDALALETAQVTRLASLRAQLELAASTARQLRAQYLNGAADFIDMLTAEREQQGLQRDLLSAQLARVELRIGLHRALAGGFATKRETPPTESASLHSNDQP